METLLGILLAIGWIMGFVLARILTTFIHEMGHALPSLAFTNEEVQIHIGSYGDDKNSSHFTIGRLKTFFKFDFLHWNIGLCKHQGATKYWERFIIILGGPVFSLSIGIVLLFLILTGEWSDLVKVIFTCFILSSIWDFVVNIFPSKNPLLLHDGALGYNDGTLLMRMIQERKLPPSYFAGINFFNRKKYHEAAASFQEVIEDGYDIKNVRLLLISSLIEIKKYDKALEISIELFEKKQLDISEYPILGNLFMVKNDYGSAIEIYNSFLFKYYDDPVILNNRGYCFLQIGQYEKAIHDLDSAIIHDPKFADAYNNRGLAKVRLSQTEEGLADINKSKSLDDSNADVYLHLGYYFQKINQVKEAHENFQKAKDMEIDFHGIDYLIETTRENEF